MINDQLHIHTGIYTHFHIHFLYSRFHLCTYIRQLADISRQIQKQYLDQSQLNILYLFK